jgi:anti-sigma factor RsiW
MTCDDARLLLHAYLDDELDAAHSAAMARHLQSCTTCAAQYNDHGRLRKALAQPGLYRQAPASLRARWTPAAAAPAQAPRRRRPALALAAGIAAAALLAGSLWFGALHRPAEQALIVGEAVSSHLRSLQPQHLTDVISTDQHTVKPWFEGKLDFAPKVKDLASEGFPLTGGRLDALDGHSVAALIYRRRLHVINLYQWPADTPASAQQLAQQHGYTVIRWTAGGMHYVAVSDLNEGELKQFTLAFQND